MKNLVWLMACAVWCFAGFLFGLHKEKHWQDEWYAAHITVTPRSECRLPSGETCVVLSVSDWQDLVRKSFHPVEAPPPPKPQKGSKRRSNIKSWTGDNSGGGTITLPASTWFKCPDGSYTNYPCSAQPEKEPPLPKWNKDIVSYDCPKGWEPETDLLKGEVWCQPEGTIARHYQEVFKPVVRPAPQTAEKPQ